MRHRAFFLAGSFAAVAAAWACNEQFPAELAGHPPSFVAPDAGDGGDADADARAVVPKGTRTLGIEVTIDALDFPDEVRRIVDAGARTTNASFRWDDVEIPIDAGEDADADASPDAARTAISNAGLHIVNLVLGSSNVRASFAIVALDATGPRLPVDLSGRALDDPEVGARYDAVTDYAFTQLGDLTLDAYLVAADVDQALGTDAAKWQAFAAFVDRAAQHARTKRAGLAVGFVMSAAALVEKRELAAGAIAVSDVVVVTEPASFDAIADAAPAGKPVFVHRLSLDAGDAFAQWDRHADRIPIVTFPAASADVVREARARGF